MLVRSDLPSPGHRTAQCVHAAIEAARHGLIPSEDDPPHLVVLAVSSSEDLGNVRRELVRHGVKHSAYYEPDLDDSLTAIATAPVEPEQRRLFRRLPLL